MQLLLLREITTHFMLDPPVNVINHDQQSTPLVEYHIKCSYYNLTQCKAGVGVCSNINIIQGVHTATT